ncbi:winged helix-turn-helix transcriptional regulator [Acidithiobacillus ferriphilus]|uniref:winged helix-turn-helix transcriptional regulator n=1 Tax=Acidithiobacillus ferriphilus TaxID=1689834 RepID=UPI00398AF090
MDKHRPRRPPPPENCPLDTCLRLLSGAWTPKVLWYLCDEPRRFGDLRRDIGTITSKVLTTRLREMEALGVVAREVIPTSPPQVSYSLTALGRELKPVLEAMARVGEKLGGR